MALNKIISEGIKDGEVKNADIATGSVDPNDINTVSGTAGSDTYLRGDAKWVTPPDTTTPADESVTLAKFAHGTSDNNGKFLRSNNGADPTWETVVTSIADESITLAKLEHGDGNTDGKFLRSNNGADPTWVTVSAGITSDGQQNTTGGTGAGDNFSGTNATNNTLIGYNTGTEVDTGDNNTAYGHNAMAEATSASANTCIGVNAGTSIVDHSNNTYVGSDSGRFNVGTSNVAIGTEALEGVDGTTDSDGSTAIGFRALTAVTSGTNNTAVGKSAGDALTTALDCTFLGKDAGGGVTTGNYNISIGNESMLGAVTGTANVNVGRDGLRAITGGNYNINIGNDGNRTGTGCSNNISIGHESLKNNTGSHNTAVGHKSLFSQAGGEHNVAVGYLAGQDHTTGFYNTLVGSRAGENITEGGYMVGIGMDSLKAVTTGNYGTAVGMSSGYSLTSGTQFTALGYEAGKTNSTAGYMTAVGYRALKNANGTSGNAEELTAVGAGCLENNTTGQYNTAVGSYALNTLTAGSSNIAIGKSAGYDCNSTGNILIGVNAGDEITDGNFNTCLGYQTGSNTTDLTTGNKNILIGAYCHTSSSSGGNQVVMGYNVSGKGDNTFYCDQNPYHLGNSTSWSTTSDRRIKKNIVDNTVGLDAINQIRVRNFEYRTYDEITELDNPAAAVVNKEGVQIGCIAQELETVLPSAVNTNEDDVKSVINDPIIWALVNSVKELSAKNDALEARLATLEST